MAIVLSTILPIVAFTDDYKPLTDTEVDNYLKTISYEQLIDEIRTFDLIEHSDPEIIFPERTIIIEGYNLHIIYGTPYIDIKIANYLQYHIPVEDEVLKDFIPKPENRFFDSVISSSAASLMGIMLYAALPIDSEFVRGVAGFSGGAATGIIVFKLIGIF